MYLVYESYKCIDRKRGEINVFHLEAPLEFTPFLSGGKQPLLQRDLRHSGEHPATVWNRTHLCHHGVSSGGV